jgi:hypothetical protein
MIASLRRMTFPLLILSLAPAMTLLAESIDSHLLDEGEEWTISDIDSNTPIRVSDQSIIKAKVQDGNRLQIRAVRAGIAELSYKKRADDQNHKIQIVVRNKRELRSFPPNKRGAFPTTLCQEPGVICVPERGLITGTTSSFEWRNHARKLCKQSGICQVNVELSPDGRQRQLTDLRKRLGSKYRVNVSADGLPLVLIDCPHQEKTWTKEHMDFLLSGAVSSGDVGVECSPAFRFGHFVVKARVTAIDTQALSQIGFEQETNILKTLGVIRSADDWIEKLHDLQQNNLATVLGEPMLELDGGVVGKISSGSEIAYRRSDKDSQTDSVLEWHQLGLSMEVSVTAQDGDYVVLSYKVTLKIPSEATGHPKNNTSNVEGEVKLKLDELHVIATSQIQSDRNDHSSSLIIAKVPIIGPLLSWRGSGSSTATVVVGFTVSNPSPE